MKLYRICILGITRNVHDADAKFFIYSSRTNRIERRL
jgi:hypothetical protein